MSGWKGYSSALETTSKSILGDKEIKVTAYNIGGYNYFKLRELATVLNFSVEWEEGARCVLIETTAGVSSLGRYISSV